MSVDKHKFLKKRALFLLKKRITLASSEAGLRRPLPSGFQRRLTIHPHSFCVPVRNTPTPVPKSRYQPQLGRSRESDWRSGEEESEEEMVARYMER